MSWIYAVALLFVGATLGFFIGAFLAICAEDAREKREQERKAKRWWDSEQRRDTR